MFKPRAIRITLEKPTTNDTNVTAGPDETPVEARIAYANDLGRELIKDGMKLVAFYVAIDTARKVLITLAQK